MARIGTIVLLILSAWSLGTVKGQTGKTDSTEYQLLWEVTGNGLQKPSWLFGTFHTRDSRAFQFPDSLMIAIDRCDAIATELDPDSLMRYSYLIQLASEGRERGYHYLYGGPHRYDITSKGVVERLPINELPQLAEWLYDTQDFFGALNARTQMPTFLDAFLYRVGVVHGKKFVPMETVAEQLGVYEERYEEDDYSVYEVDGEEEEEEEGGLTGRIALRKEMIRLYQAGDIEGMHELMVRLHSRKKKYYKALIDDRNVVMADRMNEFMHQQSIFVAVGAGHLGGDEGVVNLLRKKGYHLRPVVATYKKEPHVFKSPETELPWKNVTLGNRSVAASMPPSALQWSLPEWNSEICYAPDISTGTMYFLLPFDLNGLGKFKAKKLVSSVKDGISDLNGYRLAGETKLSVEEGILEEWKFKLRKDQKMLVRMHLNGNMGYLAGVIQTSASLPHNDIDRFWKGIVMNPSPGTDWKKVNNPTIGFRVDLPSDQLSLQIPEDFADNAIVFKDVLAANDISSRIHFRVTWQNPGAGNYFSNDSLALQSVIDDFAELTGCNQDQFTRFGEMGSFPTADAMLSDFWSDTYYQLKAVLRGSRLVLFISASNDKEGFRFKSAPFFTSIEVMEPTTADPLEKFTGNEKDFSVLMPPQRKTTSESIEDDPYFNYSNPSLISRSTTGGNGKETEFVYMVMEEKYSPFTYFESYEAFFKDALDLLIDEELEIESEEHEPFEGMPAVVYKVKIIHSDQVMRVREVWNGEKLISQLQVFLPEFKQLGPDLSWNSLKIEKAPAGFSVTDDKSNILMEFLFSRDSTKIENAVNWAKDQRIHEDDSAKVWLKNEGKSQEVKNKIWNEFQAILQSTSDESAKLKAPLLSAYLMVVDSSDVANLVTVSNALSTKDSVLQKEILTVLAELNSRESVQAFADLLSKSPYEWDYLEGYLLLNPFRYNDRNVDALFPLLLGLVDDSNLSPDILELFELGVASKKVNPQDYPSLYDDLKIIIERDFLRRYNDVDPEDDPEGDLDPQLNIEYSPGNLIRLLSHYEAKGDWEGRILDFFAERGTPEQQIAVLICRLTRGMEMPENPWATYGPQSGHMRTLYNGLKSLDRLDQFPQIWAVQDSFAVCDIANYYNDEFGTTYRFEVISKYENSVIEDGQVVYFLRGNVGKEEGYAFFSGPFKTDPTDFNSTFDFTGSSYANYNEYSPDEHWEFFYGGEE